MRAAAEAAAARVVARCRELAQITDVPGETTRTFLSDATHRAHALVSEWMRAAGMRVEIDAMGNVRGVLETKPAGGPRLLMGSHLDTVINAGAFDGPLGVVLGIELVEAAAAQGAMPCAMEVIGFSDEEGVRFGRPFLASSAIVGAVDDAALELKDASGISVRQAIANFGLDPEQMPQAVVDPHAFGYVEFHIEQGPVLESDDTALAVVESIAGQTRRRVNFRGRAGHAGTTPMGALRRDAVAAAAEWIVEVERQANGSEGLVATVGKVDVPGGAGNVIAGACTATLDVRHADDPTRERMVDELIAAAERAGAKRGVEVSWEQVIEQRAVAMDAALTEALAEACARATEDGPRRMVSGAGHDAMILARRMPAAMMFLRTPAGLSHHPDESVREQDVAKAFMAAMEFLGRLRDDRAMLSRLVTHAREYGSEVPHA